MHAYMNEYFRAVGLIHYSITFVLMVKWFQMIKILFLFLNIVFILEKIFYR